MPVNAEQLMVEVRADVAQAVTSLRRVEAQTAGMASRSSRSLGGLAKSWGLAFGGAAVVGGIGKTISLAKDFDLVIRQVGVQTGETGKGLTDLGELAKKMGADTIYSASDAGQAMLELAKGGLTSAQIKAGALNTTLLLAAAGGLDLAASSSYVTQAMTTFGIKAAKAQQVATALAGGANASTASVESLGMALSQVGPGAKNAGMSLQETVAALAAFDNAGIKGADAGTSFKTFLTSLVPTTDKASKAMAANNLNFVDAQGNFKSLANVSQQLKENLGDLSDAERTRALKTIFGSDATRAATVLMENGAKGVRKYIKATKDEAAAQDMANTAMEGAAGAWENFKGTVETAAIDVGQKALPMVTDALTMASDMVADVSDWGPNMAESFGWVKPAAEDLVGVLSGLAGIVGDLAGWFNDLPGPVKSVATQVGLFALIMPRLTGALYGNVASLRANAAALATWAGQATTAATRGAALQTAYARMGSAIRAGAGVAGMVALTQASQESNDALSTLESTAGGAALGFAVAGPWGAAIGGAAGLLKGIASSSNEARDAAKKAYADMGETDGVDQAKEAMEGLRTSLDQVTGAYTGATRAAVLDTLQKSGALEQGAKYNISAREMVNAALGQKGAFGALQPVIAGYSAQIADLDAQQQAVKDSAESYVNVSRGGGKYTREMSTAAMEQIAALDKQRDALVKAKAEVEGMPAALRQMGADTRAAAAATTDYTGKLKGIPGDVKTHINTYGVEPSAKGIAGLVKQYKSIDKKDIKTIIRATGADTTVKQVRKVADSMKDVGNAKPNLNGWFGGIVKGVGLGVRAAVSGGKNVTQGLDKAGKGSKPDMGPWLNGLRSGIRSGVREAEKANQVGAQMKAGVISGFAGTQQALVNAAVAAVRAAIKAARAEAKIKSPSRKMYEIGDYMGQGLANGLMGRKADVEKAGKDTAEAGIGEAGKAAKKKAKEARERLKDAGKDLAQGLVDGIKEGGPEVERTLKRIAKWGKKWLKGDAEDNFVASVKRANTQLAGLYRDRAAMLAQLEAAQATLDARRAVRDDFVSNTRQGMAQQATVLNAGNDAGTIKSSLMAQVAKVREFAGLLQQLRDMGYSNAILTQVASAGVEGGMQAARALASASASDQSGIQSAFDEIGAIAGTSANSLGSQLYDAGINAAQAVVDGLTQRSAQINDQITVIGRNLSEQIKTSMEKGGKKGAEALADGVKDKQERIGNSLREAGSQAGAGLINGIQSREGELKNAMMSLAQGMQAAIKKALGIASPSKVMASLGGYAGQGLVDGLLAQERKVALAGARLAGAAAQPIPVPRTMTPETFAPSPEYAAVGQSSVERGVTFIFQTYNPVAEPQSRTTNNALDRAASVGLV